MPRAAFSCAPTPGSSGSPTSRGASSASPAVRSTRAGWCCAPMPRRRRGSISRATPIPSSPRRRCCCAPSSVAICRPLSTSGPTMPACRRRVMSSWCGSRTCCRRSACPRICRCWAGCSASAGLPGSRRCCEASWRRRRRRASVSPARRRNGRRSRSSPQTDDPALLERLRQAYRRGIEGGESGERGDLAAAAQRLLDLLIAFGDIDEAPPGGKVPPGTFFAGGGS